MIGNDIIDLEVPISKNWNTKRYLDKLFDPNEQKFIDKACTPKNTLKLFWSLKEASYKAHQRRFDSPRKFNPIDFQCEIISENKTIIHGEVRINDHTYFTISTNTSSFIHSIASKEKEQASLMKIFEVKNAIQKEILAEFSLLLKEPITNLKIQKNKNFIPILYRDSLKLEHSFSTSHHGKYSAFVIALMNS